METQIPLLPSENPPNCIPPEKRALTFGGALCSVSAGGEKNKFTSTRCSHDHVSCTHAYVSSSVVSTRFFFQCGNGKCMNWEKSVKTVQFQLAFYFAVVAMLLGNYVNARVSSRRRSSLPPLLLTQLKIWFQSAALLLRKWLIISAQNNEAFPHFFSTPGSSISKWCGIKKISLLIIYPMRISKSGFKSRGFFT